ncbi:restriction endonuclease subunit S [Pontibacillus halophilus]|uniref:restriction endonuclease subunit S n=1 Tax=Pontibacillus halophilus TaxID=516704 RepID=UPI0003F5F3DC|nr:restriction endonuclease subunit S [Pontibacillus halophilus]
MKYETTLKEVTSKIGSGATPKGGKQSYLESGPFSLIRSQNVYNNDFSYAGLAYITQAQADKLKNVTINEGDILINITGDSVARCCLVPNSLLPARVNQHVAIIRCNTEVIDTYYLLAILTSFKMQEYLISIAQVGGTRAALNKKMLENLKIPLLPMDVQRQIGATLRTLNEKIELNNNIISNLEELARTLFRRWFIDFEFPNENGEPYRSSGGKMVESELGLIPEGWEVTKLGNIVTTVSKGTTPTRKDLDSAVDDLSVYFIKVRDISDNGVINYKSTQKIPLSIHQNKLKRSVLKENDILFSIAGTIGRVSYVNKLKKERNINQAIAFIRLANPMYFNLVYQLLKTKSVQEDVKSKVVQGVQANVSLSVLKEIRVPVPSQHLLKKYNEIFDSSFKQAEELKTQMDTLSDVRDTLLPKLLSGEINLDKESEVMEDALV